MTKPNKTDITFVIDRSGSMSAIAEAMNSGFEEIINKQKLEPGECCVSVAQFDDQYELLYLRKPLSEVPEYTLVARGNTALLDAVGRTLQQLGQAYSAMREEDRPSRVVVVVITDEHYSA